MSSVRHDFRSCDKREKKLLFKTAQSRGKSLQTWGARQEKLGKPVFQSTFAPPATVTHTYRNSACVSTVTNPRHSFNTYVLLAYPMRFHPVPQGGIGYCGCFLDDFDKKDEEANHWKWSRDVNLCRVAGKEVNFLR